MAFQIPPARRDFFVLKNTQRILTKFPIRLYNSRGFNEKHKAKNVVFGKTYSFYSLSGAFRPEAFAVISAKSLLISILLLLIMNL